MKNRFSLFLSLAILFVFVCTVSSCKINITTDHGESVKKGGITGCIQYKNLDDSSGIHITIEKSDGIKNTKVNSVESVMSAYTDKNGKFSFNNIITGLYTVHVSSEDSTEKEVTINVKVVENLVTDIGDLVLNPTGKICGKITLDNSSTKSDVFIVSVADTSYMVTTNIDGSFEISGIPVGENYTIVIMYDTYSYTWKTNVQVKGKDSVSSGSINFDSETIIAIFKGETDKDGDDSHSDSCASGCHDFEEQILSKATCGKPGEKILICKNCGISDCVAYIEAVEHVYDSDTFVCVVCGEKQKEFTVKEFIAALGSSVTEITADSSKPGISKSDDGKTVNVYGVSIRGEFNERDTFPFDLISADLRGLDTSEVTDMSYMFYSNVTLRSLDLSSFDTSNVIKADNMFYLCIDTEIKYSPSKWTLDFSEITSNCLSFTWIEVE